MLKIISQSEKETINFASQFAKYLKPTDIICLKGNLGAGKTTFVKGLARGLKIKQSEVNSPTFVLMNIYQGKLPLYHFDFYRIDDVQLIGGIGYDEFLYGKGVTVIEWADKMGALIPKKYISIDMKVRGEHQREIKVTVKGKDTNGFLDKISYRMGKKKK